MRSGSAVADQRSLGARVADASEEERRWRCGAWIARPGIEPATGRECAHEGVETGAGQVLRFWTDAGLRVSGEARRRESEPGDAAAVADRGRVAAGEAAEGGGGARLAPTAELPRRTGAVGHFRARLVGRARAEAIPGDDDRRRYQPSLRSFSGARQQRGESTRTVGLSGGLGPAGGVLHGQEQPVYGKPAGAGSRG